MSFFSKGFSCMLNERRLTATKKGHSGKDVDSSSGKAAANKEELADEGRWERLTDVYGRTYWQHSVTGEWSYGVGGGLVSPVLAVNPSPIVGYPGAVFSPSTIFAAPLAPPAKKGNEKKEEVKKDASKKEGKGWWEAVFDDRGNRCWVHTVTNRMTHKDPYY
eukprot:g8560.t1